jgi:hypothetical protein
LPDNAIRIGCAQSERERFAVQARHFQVENGCVRPLPDCQLKPGLAPMGHAHCGLRKMKPEQQSEKVRGIGFVVGDEDHRLCHRTLASR